MTRDCRSSNSVFRLAQDMTQNIVFQSLCFRTASECSNSLGVRGFPCHGLWSTSPKMVLDGEALDALAVLQIAGPHASPIAAARHEQSLLAIACKPGLGRVIALGCGWIGSQSDQVAPHERRCPYPVKPAQILCDTTDTQ